MDPNDPDEYAVLRFTQEDAERLQARREAEAAQKAAKAQRRTDSRLAAKAS